MSLGVSGLVELSEEEYAIKSPWPPGSEDSLSDMRFEAMVYNHLDSHHRLIKVIDWDAEECCLTMENMSNGTLKDYLEKNNACISEPQRRRWILQAVEVLAYLHTKGVIHYDFKPKSVLLDENLEAKIADFGCSAFNGLKPTAGAGLRYTPPKGGNISSGVQLDIFAFGSTIYAILTGKDPFVGDAIILIFWRMWRLTRL
ncbi:kinase-like protein [Aureobasidium pullulans]|nr:kinase-like protein [Aureobasidium pullulans]